MRVLCDCESCAYNENGECKNDEVEIGINPKTNEPVCCTKEDK